MRVLLAFLVLASSALARTRCVLDLPSYLIGNGGTGYTCVAPSSGDSIQRLPTGYRVVIADSKRYYTYGGVYYVDDSARGSRVYRVVDSPLPVNSSQPSGKITSLTLNGNQFKVTLDNGSRFYVEHDSELVEVLPPPGSYLEGLPSGVKSLVCGDLRCYVYNGVLYTRTSINDRSVYVAIDKTDECE